MGLMKVTGWNFILAGYYGPAEINGLVNSSPHFTALPSLRQGCKIPPLGIGRKAKEGFQVINQILTNMEKRCFGVLLLHSILQNAISDNFKVIGAKHPITVAVGEDVVLQCQMVPGSPLESLEVRWFKSDYTSPVHLYNRRQDQPNVQDKAYQGRTELFKDEFPHGNASLKLKKIRASDEGNYTCFIDSKTHYEEAVINLKVGAAGFGQQPWIHLEGIISQRVRLECKSDGWYPEPHVQWLDGNGQLVTAQPVTIHQKDASGLFTVLTQIDVTSDSLNRFSCLMQNSLLNKEEEAHLQIPEAFFPKVNVWLVIFWVFVGLVVAIVVLEIILHRRKRRKIKELQLFCILEGHDNQEINYPSLTLDKDTAHLELKLSDDQKSVRWTGISSNLPDTKERFSNIPCVLGLEGFKSGRHYWEVEVTGNGEWSVGVAADSVDRKGQIELKPEKHFWLIGWQGNHLVVSSSLPSDLPPSNIPKRIGVYLNYESGAVSFYNASTKCHLYTFSGNKFTEKLCPLMRILENVCLKICPRSVKRF
ncbi:butyrophilin subfamily 1 member A1-like isoform X3 [Cetorhinus maximus]